MMSLNKLKNIECIFLMESLHKKNKVMMSLNKLKNIECDGKST